MVVRVAGAELHCQAFAAPVGGCTVLHFHGNGEVVSDYGDWPKALAARGLGLVLAEYRGYGGSSGTPSLVGMLDDALAVFDALDLPGERVIVYGRSVGSMYGLHVAANRSIRALVLESGIAHPLQRILIRLHPAELGCSLQTLEAEALAHLDHRAKLEAVDAPVVVFHTVRDHLVAFEHGEQLAAWSGGELIALEPGDHNSILAYHRDAILDRVAALAR
jgi:fermentation-respiration switch protein FrsA (DUF1100 family)